MEISEANAILDMMLDGLIEFDSYKYWEAVHRIELDDKLDDYITKHN